MPAHPQPAARRSAAVLHPRSDPYSHLHPRSNRIRTGCCVDPLRPPVILCGGVRALGSWPFAPDAGRRTSATRRYGVPETPAVWHGLLAALDRPDTVALSLPGFDSARPAGFGATMEEYAGWLVGQLERLGDPVDLVGHDWGGGFVVRVVSTRPELVRSWVTDAAGIGDVEFEWHDFAKIWQTPQAGEDF